jgi:hypothetical protein
MKYIIFCGGLILSPLVNSAELVVHGASRHFNPQPYYNNLNLGLSYRSDTACHSGKIKNTWVGGAYHNTEHRLSIYVGCHYTFLETKTFEFGTVVGGVTGYAIMPVLPAVVVTGKLKLNQQWSIITTVAPINQGAVTLSLGYTL